MTIGASFDLAALTGGRTATEHVLLERANLGSLLTGALTDGIDARLSVLLGDTSGQVQRVWSETRLVGEASEFGGVAFTDAGTGLKSIIFPKSMGRQLARAIDKLSADGDMSRTTLRRRSGPIGTDLRWSVGMIAHELTHLRITTESTPRQVFSEAAHAWHRPVEEAVVTSLERRVRTPLMRDLFGVDPSLLPESPIVNSAMLSDSGIGGQYERWLDNLEQLFGVVGVADSDRGARLLAVVRDAGATGSAATLEQSIARHIIGASDDVRLDELIAAAIDVGDREARQALGFFANPARR